MKTKAVVSGAALCLALALVSAGIGSLTRSRHAAQAQGPTAPADSVSSAQDPAPIDPNIERYRQLRLPTSRLETGEPIVFSDGGAASPAGSFDYAYQASDVPQEENYETSQSVEDRPESGVAPEAETPEEAVPPPVQPAQPPLNTAENTWMIGGFTPDILDPDKDKDVPENPDANPQTPVTPRPSTGVTDKDGKPAAVEYRELAFAPLFHRTGISIGQAIEVTAGGDVNFPLDLTLSYDFQEPVFKGVLPELIGVYFYDTESGSWSQEGITVLSHDVSSGEVKFRTTHLTIFRLGIPEDATPSIDRIRPEAAVTEAPVRIHGAGFSPVAARNLLTAGGALVMIGLDAQGRPLRQPLNAEGDSLSLVAESGEQIDAALLGAAPMDYSSWTRTLEGNAESGFARHSELGALFSPGTRADGRPFDRIAGGTPAAPQPGDLLINEVLLSPKPSFTGDANGDGETTPIGDAFVEVLNASGRPLDIGGVTLLAGGKAFHHFPQGMVLPRGGAAVVFGVDDAAQPSQASGLFGGTPFLPEEAADNHVKALVPELPTTGAQWITLSSQRRTSNPVFFQALVPGDPALFGFTAEADALPPLALEDLRVVRSGDIDGDLDLDLVVLSGIRTLTVLANDGDGLFSIIPAAALPADVREVFDIELADLNGDAVPEIIIGDGGLSSAHTRLVILGSGGEGLRIHGETAAGNPATALGARSLAVADIDGDGDRDVVVSLVGEGPMLFRNEDGVLEHRPARDRIGHTRPLAPTAIRFEDSDSDGDSDLLLAGERRGRGPFPTLQLFLNDGQGGFEEALNAMPDIRSGLSLLWSGDADGDEDIDLMAGGPESAAKLARRGADGYALEDLDPSASGALAWQVEDFDADGDPDVLLATTFGLRLLLNNGSGVFTAGSLPEGLAPAQALASGDFDNDGDLDAISGGDAWVLLRNSGASQNHRPRLEPFAAPAVMEGELVEFEVRARDADNDALTLQAFAGENQPLSAIGAAFEDLGDGRGRFTWRPAVGQGLPEGRLYPVRFTVSDGRASDSLQTVIRVYRENRPPSLQAIPAISVDEGEPIGINLAALASDPDGDALSFSLSITPSASGATLENGHFMWTPGNTAGDGPQGYQLYTATFIVTDPAGASAQQQTVIKVYDVFQGGNHPPVFNLQDRQVPAGETLTFTVEVVDADGDELSVTVRGTLPVGSTFDAGSREFSWTPLPTQLGQHSVGFAANDGHVTVEGYMLIDVLPAGANHAPVIEVDTDVEIGEGERLELPIRVTDPDGDSVELSVVGGLPRGAQLLGPGADPAVWTLDWLPDMNQRGSYIVIVEATDGMLQSRAQLRLRVANNVLVQRLNPAIGWIPADAAPQSTPLESIGALTQATLQPGSSVGFDFGAYSLTRVHSIKLLHRQEGVALDAASLEIYVSGDNQNYTPVTAALQVTAQGNWAQITGFSAGARYVKIHRRADSPAQNTAIANTLPEIAQVYGSIPAATGAYDTLEALGYEAFLYFYENVSATGLVPDRVHVDGAGANSAGEVYSTGATGFWLAVIPMAVERGWISRAEGEELALRTLRKYRGAGTAAVEGHEGFFYHFVNADGSRYLGFVNDGVAVLDSAILFVGALACAQYFDAEVETLANELVAAANWEAFYDHDYHMLRMWWSPEGGYIRHLDYISEGMIAYILAAGSQTHPIDFALDTKLEAEGDAYYAFSRGSYGRILNRYGRDGRPLLQTFFGSLFAYLYPPMFIDLEDRRDDFYFDWTENSREAVLANYRFAQANAQYGYSPVFWGLSASDGPQGYQGLYGAEPHDSGAGAVVHDGTIAAYALAGSLPFAADLAVPALLNLAEMEVDGTPVRGRYGLRNGINARLGFVSDEYLGIDQGALLLGLDGYLGGFVQQLITTSPFIQRALDAIGLDHKQDLPLRLDGPRAEHAYLRVDSAQRLVQTVTIAAADLPAGDSLMLEVHPQGMDNAQGLRYVDVDIVLNGQLLKKARFHDRSGRGVADLPSVYIPVDRGQFNQTNNVLTFKWLDGERWVQLENVRLEPTAVVTNTWVLGAIDETGNELSAEREVDDSCYVAQSPQNCARALNRVDEPQIDLLYRQDDNTYDRRLILHVLQTQRDLPVTLEISNNGVVVGKTTAVAGQTAVIDISRIYMERGWNALSVRHAGYADEGEYLVWDAIALEETTVSTYLHAVPRNVDDQRVGPIVSFGSEPSSAGVVGGDQYVAVYFDITPSFGRLTISTDNRDATAHPRFTGAADASASGLVGEVDSTTTVPLLWQVHAGFQAQPPVFTDTVEWAYVVDESQSDFNTEGVINYRTLINRNRVLGDRPSPGRMGGSPIAVYFVADLREKPAQRYTTETLTFTILNQ